VLLDRLKKENGFKENKATLDYIVSLADSTLFEGNFTYNPEDKILKNELLLIGKRSISGTEFLAYTNGKKRYTQNVSPGHYMRLLYQTFADEQVLAYEESNLAEKHREYRMVVKEYREGLLLFQLMEENVWNKAQKDTVGLKAFFEQQSGQYKWDARAQLVMLESSNEEVIKKAILLLNEPRYPSKEPAVQDVTFNLNSSSLTTQDSLRLRTYVRSFIANNSLQMEITGYAVKKEKSAKGRNLATDRANEIVSVLRHYGIPADRLFTVPATLKKGQAEPGAIATLKVFSTSKKAIEQLANQSDPLALKVTEGKFQQKDLSALKRVNMEKGEYNFFENGRYVHLRILEIEPPRNKTLEEARGQAISDYQNKLDQDWISELRKKYPVKINEAEFQKLVKK
jgi:peptidyl-prolyl cis-trans isomerase SurA